MQHADRDLEFRIGLETGGAAFAHQPVLDFVPMRLGQCSRTAQHACAGFIGRIGPLALHLRGGRG
ncbi:hypothetical protein D3C81_1962470 [compost metagenome]